MLPEAASKDTVSIGHNVNRESMEFVDIVQKNFGNFARSKRMKKRYEMAIFGKLVDHNENTIGLQRSGQALNEVQRDGVPSLNGLLTNSTRLYILTDNCLHTGPIEQ